MPPTPTGRLGPATTGPEPELALNGRRWVLLAALGLTAVLAIPVGDPVGGTLAGLVALGLIAADPDCRLRRRLGVLLGCLAILAATDINTSTSTRNFVRVGLPFFLVILLPALILGRTDPGVIRYRLWPKVHRRADVIYALLSLPLAFGVLQLYWWLTPDLYRQWSLPEQPDEGEIRRLFIGINLVGIWDELFFVNTVYAILRSLFRYPVANLLQAVVYTSVLYDMAFVGAGPLIVFAFAWTQGSMFEKSEGLLWVLIVHLVVDFFLVAAIVHSYYPDYGLDFLWRHGM